MEGPAGPPVRFLLREVHDVEERRPGQPGQRSETVLGQQTARRFQAHGRQGRRQERLLKGDHDGDEEDDDVLLVPSYWADIESERDNLTYTGR